MAVREHPLSSLRERLAWFLRAAADRVSPGVDQYGAPWDDEPLTPEDEVAIAEAEADIKAGRVTPWEDVKRELGL